jgi:hypothetical protein
MLKFVKTFISDYDLSFFYAFLTFVVHHINIICAFFSKLLNLFPPLLVLKLIFFSQFFDSAIQVLSFFLKINKIFGFFLCIVFLKFIDFEYSII